MRNTILTLLLLLASAPAQEAQQKTFESPEQAFDALIEACRKHDVDGLSAILGHKHRDLVDTGDRDADRAGRVRLCAAVAEGRKIERDGESRAVLILGKEAWPLPVPVVKEDGRWRFDTAAGREEILNRRIGEHELSAIAACKDYVEAQLDYASQDRDGDQVLEYAQRIKSTAGQRDGLYWPVDPDSDEELSPLGPMVAEHSLQGKKDTDPYQGYYFRILTRQGAHPPGGKYDYVINGNMIAGFALVAYPVAYGKSGIMTFVVSHQGKVYEKDLGEKTAAIAAAMTEYDPDKTWKPAEE